MPDASLLTVKQAAQRLGMTPQGVRKAVRERRLDGTARLLPSGKREYRVSEEAVEAYLAGAGTRLDSEIEALSMRLALVTNALHDKELEVVELRARLEAAEREVKKTTQALHLQIEVVRAFAGEDESQSGPAGGRS